MLLIRGCVCGVAREYAAHAELGFISLFAKKDADVTN